MLGFSSSGGGDARVREELEKQRKTMQAKVPDTGRDLEAVSITPGKYLHVRGCLYLSYVWLQFNEEHEAQSRVCDVHGEKDGREGERRIECPLVSLCSGY